MRHEHDISLLGERRDAFAISIRRASRQLRLFAIYASSLSMLIIFADATTFILLARRRRRFRHADISPLLPRRHAASLSDFPPFLRRRHYRSKRRVILPLLQHFRPPGDKICAPAYSPSPPVLRRERFADGFDAFRFHAARCFATRSMRRFRRRRFSLFAS